MFAVPQGARIAEFGIDQEQIEDVLVLSIRGELDLATVPALRVQLDGALERDVKRLVVDLAEVTFVDSISVAALLTAARRIGPEGRFALVVHRESYGMLVFEAGGIETVLPLFETRDHALAHARS
jgi:anti-sigma B factor antagonist